MISHPKINTGELTIVGICGFARAGKDTAAKVFESFGFTRIAYADALKATIGNIDHGLLYKKYLGRFAWQFGGSEVGRAIDPELWIKMLFMQVVLLRMLEDRRKFVLPDVRYPNEADFLHQWGGRLVRIVNPTAEKIEQSDHSSEAYVEKLPADAEIVYNDRRHLFHQIEDFLNEYEHVMAHYPVEAEG